MDVLEDETREEPIAGNFIDGEWVESKEEIIGVVNPATCDVIGHVGFQRKRE